MSAPSYHAKMTPISRFSWQSYLDETPSNADDRSFSGTGLYEQLNVTRDNSDYLWYTTEYVTLLFNSFTTPLLTTFFSMTRKILIIDLIYFTCSSVTVKRSEEPILTVMSSGHALNVFVNGQFQGRFK